MRTTITSLMLLASVLFMSCTKDIVGTIEMFQHTVAVDSWGGQKSFIVKSSHEWSATCDADWITILTETGPSGDSKVKFTADTYWETTPRETTIVLTNTATTQNYSMMVKQSAFEPVFEVSPESIEFPNSGGVDDFSVTANFEFDITCEADWISFENTQEKGIRAEESDGEVVYESEKIIFSVAKSAVAEVRSADIVITCTTNNEIQKVVTVSQAAFEPKITYSSGESLTVSAKEQKKYLTFNSNIPFVFL